MGKSNRRSEGQYVPLPYGQIKSPAWRALSGPAVKLWLELHTRFNGGNNGSLRLSYAEAAEAHTSASSSRKSPGFAHTSAESRATKMGMSPKMRTPSSWAHSRSAVH